MSDKKEKENVFEILDGIMLQLSRTKKMFLVMILTVLIIPPIALLVMTSIFEPPFGSQFEQQFEQRMKERLELGQMTPEEYDNIKNKVVGDRPNRLLNPPQVVIFVISLAWLGIGIRQWIILSKWDKKYKQFKKDQKEFDKHFEDDSDENHQNEK